VDSNFKSLNTAHQEVELELNTAAGQKSGGKMENSFIQSLLLHSNTNVQQQHQQPQQEQSKAQPAEDNFYEDIDPKVTKAFKVQNAPERQ
jgi:membrane protease subunit (stomatin/prohibitin family)